MNINSKFAFTLFTFAVFVLSGGVVFAHNGEQHGHMGDVHHMSMVNKETLDSIGSEYAAQVRPIFQKSCIDCHSSRTNYPWYSSIPGVKSLIQNDIKEARTHLDLSNDFPFSGHGTPKTDLEAIRDEVNEGAMPPWRYKVLHPGSALTKEEKTTVLNWITNSLNRISSPAVDANKHGH